jgi:tetratricopeptide (TPR) repeat protein
MSWPNCCWSICYTWGPDYSFGYFWPYYHRRFIFISLGGYWPSYTYRRYYWYGCHPYRWYGDYPPGYVTAGNTYNYYYYNDAPESEALNEAHGKREETPAPEPADETLADQHFDAGVKAFESGDYATATTKFHDAMQLSPEDIVLPFAHVQALFAGGEYKKAAEALRKGLAKTSPDKEGVFYPRGLYTDESVLEQQIDQLSRAVRLNPADSDLQLVLGYQLLGMERHDEAAGHLQSARQDSKNSHAATTLTRLVEKLNKADKDNAASNKEQPNSSQVQSNQQ